MTNAPRALAGPTTMLISSHALEVVRTLAQVLGAIGLGGLGFHAVVQRQVQEQAQSQSQEQNAEAVLRQHFHGVEAEEATEAAPAEDDPTP